MDFWQSFNGMVTMEYVSADNPGALSALQERGVRFENVRFVDELTVRFSVRRQHAKLIELYADKRSDQCRILQKEGLFWKLRGLSKRPVLLIGFAILVLLTVILPTRILFYRIEGNLYVPDNQILEFVSQNGIPFGAVRRDIRSEKVKNTLLSAIPELEWVGINTSGCVATISVRERQSTDTPAQKHGVSSIVATRDGVIRELTVTSGSAAVKPGQAVKAGQVLISGYTDCGIAVRAEQASGEVYAATNRNLTFVLPENSAERTAQTGENKKNALIIGKKRINFFKDSGNLDTDCVKIYEQKYLTLPGGFQLPIAIVTEKSVSFDKSTFSATQEETRSYLTEFAQRYLHSQMVAGRILTKQEQMSQADGLLCLDGEYGCLEMIGRERNEEIIKP